MTSSQIHSQSQTYKHILSTLLPPQPSPPALPLYPSASHTPTPLNPKTTSQIASLQLHPALEICLHLLNNDLPAAHFLVRHMQDVVPRTERERAERDGDEGDEHEGCRAKSMASYAAAAGGSKSTSTSTNGASASNGQSQAQQHETYGSSNHNDQNKEADGAKAPPKLEGLLLHAILHRIEGDYENARAWYADVSSASSSFSSSSSESSASSAADSTEPNSSTTYEDVWTSVHPSGLAPTHAVLDRIISLRHRIHPSRSGPSPPSQLPPSTSESDKAELHELEAWHRKELEDVLGWCEHRYGNEKWEDGRSEFVGMAKKHADVAGKMLMGGEGWRQF